MQSGRESRYLLTTILVIAILVLDASARSWDLAVVIGNNIEFLANNGTSMGHAEIAPEIDLRSAAYDDVTRTIFFGDNSKSNVSIFSNDLTNKDFVSKPLLTRENRSFIFAMAFHSASRTLYWTDAGLQVIMKMHISMNGVADRPAVVLRLPEMELRGIAIDVCNGYIYWTNANRSSPNINRARLDGTEMRTVISEKLYEPTAISVDNAEGKLYWADDEEGIFYKIERSNLDGSERELLVHDSHQTPMYIAVDLTSFYWSDWTGGTVQTMRKHSNSSTSPSTLVDYHKSKLDADPAALMTRDNIGDVDCNFLGRIAKRIEHASKKSEPYINLTTSTEESDPVTERTAPHCLNDGMPDSVTGSCHCKRGYSGDYCETSLCYNYCLNGGACAINENGKPVCTCTGDQVGERCERYVCDDYCLNDGDCVVVNHKPECKCKYSSGLRCESTFDFTEICAMFCTSDRPELTSVDTSSCRCDETHRAEKIMSMNEGFGYGTLLPVFISLIVVLVIIVAVLTYYVNKLRRRPRIKKRFVVRKAGVTPLTSRPQLPDNQCEITIENCCNMNICETPCFEPNLRTPVPRSTSLKKEEKNSLLDNMEGNSC